MKITKKGEYALRALLALANVHGRKTLSLREVSKHEHISYKFLEQIMTMLKRAGFVRSAKGKFGGYSLSRSPKQITLAEVIRAIEGPLSPFETASEIKRRIQTDDRHPGFYSILLDVRNAISEILDQTTLADVCEKSAEIAGSKSPYQMYYI